MALLLISRGSYSGGQIMSECLSRNAGIRCITREELVAYVNSHGEVATKVTACIAKAAQNYAQFSALRRPYKILMRLALLREIRQGDLAYFGYSGHLLLPEIPHAVKVRLVASMEMRIKLLQTRTKCTEGEARETIRQVDEERTRWTRFMYGKSLRDPEFFDLCLNLERLSFPEACCLLVHAARSSDFQATPQSLSAVEDHYLATQVLADLVTDARTYELELAATAESGEVFVEGPYLEAPLVSLVKEVAGAVTGVKSVRYVEGYPVGMAAGVG
jgi:hypothetical protein